MRIGYFSYSLSGIGPRTRARTLIKSLADRGEHDLVLVTGKDESFTHPDVTVHRVALSPTSMPSTLLKTRRALAGCNLVHIPVNLYQALFVRALYAGPLVVGAGVQHTFPYRQFAKVLEVDVVIETHEFVAYLWERTGYDATYIYPSINDELFRPFDDDRIHQIREELGIPESDDVVLFVGKLNEFKGAHFLPDLARGLPEGVSVVAAGDGPIRELIESCEEITYVGYVENEHLPKYYNVADVTIVPSEAESFSLVSLESVACGTPVVTTTQRGSMVRLFRDRGTYVWADERSVDGILDSVMTLLSDDDRYKEQIERGFDAVEEMGVTIQDTIDKYEAVYERVAADRRTGDR